MSESPQRRSQRRSAKDLDPSVYQIPRIVSDEEEEEESAASKEVLEVLAVAATTSQEQKEGEKVAVEAPLSTPVVKKRGRPPKNPNTTPSKSTTPRKTTLVKSKILKVTKKPQGQESEEEVYKVEDEVTISKVESEVVSLASESSETEEEPVISHKNNISTPKTTPVKSKISSSASPRTTPLSRAKVRRTGIRIPDLIADNFGPENIFTSADKWQALIRSRNLAAKTKNRLMRTEIIRSVAAEAVEIRGQSSFLTKTSDAVNFNNDETAINNNLTFQLDRSDEKVEVVLRSGESKLYKESAFYYEQSENKPCQTLWCKCSGCKESTNHVFAYVTTKSSSFTVLKVELNSGGFDNLRVMGRIEVNWAIEEMQVTHSSRPILSVLLVDGSIQVIDCQQVHNTTATGTYKVQNDNVLRLDNDRISCHVWSNLRPSTLLVGAESGFIAIYTFTPTNSSFNCIYQQRLGQLPIYSLACSPTDENVFMAAGRYSQIFRIDLRQPMITEMEASALAPLPLVRWSENGINGVLFADWENHARRLISIGGSKNHQPLGTFDSKVNEIATSPFHNVIATAAGNGHVHLSWMPGEVQCSVELEKRMILVSNEGGDGLGVSIVPEYVKFHAHDRMKVYPASLAADCVDWSPNANFPGLLAAAYRRGLFIFLSCDRVFI